MRPIAVTKPEGCIAMAIDGKPCWRDAAGVAHLSALAAARLVNATTYGRPRRVSIPGSAI